LAGVVGAPVLAGTGVVEAVVLEAKPLEAVVAAGVADVVDVVEERLAMIRDGGGGITLACGPNRL